MKHYITKEQWNELTVDGQNMFIKPFQGMMRCRIQVRIIKGEYLSIGQMIEFLGRDFDSILYSTRYEVILDCGKIKSFKDDILCNALWEAVKYKIKKEDN